MPIVSRAKSKWYPTKGEEIGIKFIITDCSNIDKQCSSAHFVSFLFCSYYPKLDISAVPSNMTPFIVFNVTRTKKLTFLSDAGIQ